MGFFLLQGIKVAKMFKKDMGTIIQTFKSVLSTRPAVLRPFFLLLPHGGSLAVKNRGEVRTPKLGFRLWLLARVWRSWLFCWVLLACSTARALPPVYIGLDAEFGNKSSTSAQAILQGIEIAVDEVNRAGGVLGGRPLQVLVRDNKSITAVGIDNLKELAAVPDLVAVFGGKFSPVYIESLPVVHDIGILLLDPWGSADIITDHGYKPSYSFRLSIKDSWVAPAVVRFAKNHHDATQLGVLLPNTSWGRSNKLAIEKAAAASGAAVVGLRWYNWGDVSLLQSYNDLRMAGAQAIFLVANEAEGAIFVKEVAALDPKSRLPIISHWGVTGGDFAKIAGDALDQIEFSVVQSFSFINNETPEARRVVSAMQKRYGVPSAQAIKSPVGVAHAYDLTHLLARAIDEAGSTNRARIRRAMESLGRYRGLVKDYRHPFTKQRHDALSADLLFFARYNSKDELVPVR